MFGKHPRYIRGRDAAGCRTQLYFEPVRGEGTALYRKDGELIVLLPFLEIGVLRAESRDAALLAAWPTDDPDTAR